MVDDAFLHRWVERLRREESGVVAVLLKGSYARGDAGPHSDVDFDLLTHGRPRVPYPVYIEKRDGRLLHVSVAVKRLDDWLSREAEPAPWSYSLPVAEATRLLWADESVRDELDRPALLRPPGDPELEDFVECAGKVRNALQAGDELRLCLAAQDLARLCPSVLLPLNPATVVGTRPGALRAALSFPVSPPGYRDDMLTCLGMSGRATTAREVRDAALRLATGTLELLRPHAERLAPLLQPDLARYLADGTLQRYLEQDA